MKNVDEQFREILAGIHTKAADMRELDARLTERRKLNAIVTAYMLALQDPQFKCPTYLHAAIEDARRG